MTEQIGDQKAAVGTASMNRASKTGGAVQNTPASGTPGDAPLKAAPKATPSDMTASKATPPNSTAPKAAASKTVASKAAASKVTASTTDPTGGATAQGLQTRHAVLRYTTLRLALFLVALLLVWGVAVVFNMDLSSQLSKLTLLAVALLLSSAASFALLSKYRDAMSAGIVARTQKLSKTFGDAASFEDEDE